jgi:thioredoxin reductase (NADPH)
MKPEKMYDLLVLGGGIAGMTAAIFAARAGLKTVVVESDICGGLVNYTYLVENFPSYISIHGMDLMQKVREQLDHLNVAIEEIAETTRLNLISEVKEIETDDVLYRCGAIILAVGRKPVPLEIKSDCKQIHYCSVCDGPTYKEKRVLVVGGGNSGFDEALFLVSSGVKEILLIEQMNRFFASRIVQDKLFSCRNVNFRLSTKIKNIDYDKRLRSVVLENVETGQIESVELDGIFVFMGQKPNTDFLIKIVDLDKQGYIMVNENMETNLKGVYAAGDVIPKMYRQITTAMSDGTIAGLNAAKYLNSLSCSK